MSQEFPVKCAYVADVLQSNEACLSKDSQEINKLSRARRDASHVARFSTRACTLGDLMTLSGKTGRWQCCIAHYYHTEGEQPRDPRATASKHWETDCALLEGYPFSIMP